MAETPVGQKASSLGVNHNPLQQVPPKENFDFFTTVLNANRELGENYNANDHLITMKAFTDENKNYDMALYDKETLWEKNKGKYAGNREWFDKDFEGASKLYDSYRNNELDFWSFATPPTLYTKYGMKPVSGVGMIIDPKPLANYGWMNEFEFNLTPSEMAASTGKYIDINGQTKSLDFLDKINPIKNLVVDQDEKTGDYFIRQAALTEDITNQQHYSIWGAQSKYGNAILNTAGGFLSELLPGTAETFANFQKIIYGAEDSIKKYAGTEEDSVKTMELYKTALQKGELTLAKFYEAKLGTIASSNVIDQGKKDAMTAIVNMASRLKFQPSEEAEKAGWFGSMEGFFTHLGSGLSYLIPQRAAAMGLAKLFTKMGTKAILNSGDDVAKMLLKQNGYRLSKAEMSVVNAAGFGVGTIQAMTGVYTGGKRAGLSDEEASWMSVIASPFVYVTEKFVGGGWLWKDIQGDVGKKFLADEIVKLTKHEITSNGLQSAKQLTEKNLINITSNAVINFIKGSKNIGYKSWDFVKDMPFVGAGLREGTQEALEESLYVTEEILFDKIQKLQDKSAKYNTEFFSDETLKRIQESWFGGFFIGGVADAFIGRRKANDQKDLISKYVIAGKSQELRDLINDLHSKGKTGLSHIGENGQVITDDQKGKIRTINDVNKDNLLQQIDFYESVYKAGGLDSPELMQSVGGDVNLVQEGLDNLLSQHSINNEIRSISDNIDKARQQGIDTIQLEKDLKDRHNELSTVKQKHLDLVSGKRLSESIKTSLIKNLYDKVPDLQNKPVITPQSQDDFNKGILKEKETEVEKLKKMREEAELQRAESAATVAEFEKLDIGNIDQNFVQTVSKMKQLSEAGLLSPVDSQRLRTSIDKMKGLAITELEKTLSESEKQEIEAGATIEGAVEKEIYEEDLLEKAKNPATAALRTDTKIGDIVQRIDGEGNLLEGNVIVESVNADGTLSLKGVDTPVQVSEVKNLTAQQELEQQADIFNKRSALESAFQSLAGIKSKDVDLNQAFGYNDDVFTAQIYTSKKEGDNLVNFAEILQNISGITPEQASQMSEEEYLEALRQSPMMQLPETKTVLQNSIDELDNLFQKLIVNWNVYNKINRKHSGLVDENTLTKEQFMISRMLNRSLAKQAKIMLDVIDKTRMEREGRQDMLRVQDIKISHNLISYALPHLKKADADKLNKILSDAKQKMEDIEKAQREGKQVTAEDYIAVKREIIRAESILHTALNEDPKLGDKIIKDLFVYHGMDTRIAPYTAANELQGITIEKQFNVGNFVTPASQNKTEIGVTKLQNFIAVHSVNYIENIKRLDPQRFASAWKATLDSLGEFDNVPSTEQENIVKHMVAFMMNPSDGMITKSSENAAGFSLSDFLWNNLFVRGLYGSGKTTLIASTALSVYDKLNGKKAKVVSIAPSEKLAQKLADSISDNVSSVKVMTSEQFMNEGQALMGEYDIVIFDEASRFTNNDLSRINEIINNPKNTGMIRSFMLGDQSQMTSIKESTTRIPVEYRSERTLPATEVFRSGVEDVWAILESIRNSMFSLDTDLVFAATKYTKDKSRGVYQIRTDDVNVMMKEFAEDMLSNADHVQNTAIVTYSERNRADILNLLLSNSDLVLKIGKDKLESMVFHLDEGNQNAQGHEFERVYVAITPSMVSVQSSKDINFTRALLTAASRAENYIALLNPSGQSEPGPVISISPDTIDSRKLKLEKAKKWYEWVSTEGEGAVTKEESEENKQSGPEDAEPSSFGHGNIDISPEAKGGVTEPKGKSVPKGKPWTNNWKLDDVITVEFSKDNPLSRWNGKPGKITGFVLEAGVMRNNYSSYSDLLAEKKKTGNNAHFEIAFDGKIIPVSVPLENIRIYDDKKAEDLSEKEPPKDQNSYSRYEAEMSGIPIDSVWKHKTTGKVSSVTRTFKKGRSPFIVLDKNEDAPVKRADFLKNYTPAATTSQKEVLNENNRPVVSQKQRSSERFMENGIAVVEMLASQGALNQDDPTDPYVAFKKTLIAHILNRKVAPVVISFERESTLASAKGMQKFNNVVVVKYTNQSDLQEIAKRVEKETGNKVDIEKASLIGVLPQPVLLTENQALATSTNYSNETDVQKLLSAIPSDIPAAEYAWTKFLIEIRSRLAASGPMTVNFVGAMTGSLKYIPYSQPRIPVQQLISTLRRKGFTVNDDNIYFSVNEKKIVNGKPVTHSQVVLEVSAGPGLPVNKIYLETEKVNDDYFKRLHEELKDLSTRHNLSVADINNSEFYRFFKFNRSRILDEGKFLIKELENIFTVHNGIDPDVPKLKAGRQLEEYKKALTILNDLFKKNDRRVMDFNQLVSKTTKKGFNLLPRDGRYFTRVENVGFPQGFIDVASIKGALNQADQNSKQPQQTTRFKDRPVNVKKKRKPAELLNNEEKRELRDAVLRYYRKVFGEDFLKGRLEFRPNLTLTEDELYGMVANGKVYLEETEQGIEVHTKRHEAVHIVINYLLDPESGRRILSEARDEMSKEKEMDRGHIDDEMAEEYIAERAETRYKGLTGLLKKFVDWMNSLFSRYDAYKHDINQLLYAIETGRFKDQPFYENNADIVRTSRKKKDRNTQQNRIERYGEEEDLQDGLDEAAGGIKDLSDLRSLLGENGYEETIDENSSDTIQEANNKKKQKNIFRNYHALVDIFGDNFIVNQVRRYVANDILIASNYSRDFTNSPISMTDLIKELRDEYLSRSSQASQTINAVDQSTGKIYTSLAEINGINIHILNEEQLEQFVKFKLGDNKVFNTLVKKILPGINFQKNDLGVNDKPENANDHTEGLTEEDETRFNESSINDANDERDPFEKMSQHVHFHLNNMQLNTYSYDKNGNRIRLGIHPDKYVNSVKLQLEIVNAAINAQMPSDQYQKGLDEFGRFRMNIRRLAEEATIKNTDQESSSELANILWTFYDTFLNEDVITYTDERGRIMTEYSHYYLQKNFRDVITKNPEYAGNIVVYSKSSSDILNSVFTFFNSIRRNSFMKGMVAPSQDETSFAVNASKYSHSPFETDRLKSKINSDTNSTIFIRSSATGPVVSESFSDKMLPEGKDNRYFRVEKDGIFIYRRGQNIPLLSVTYEKGQPRFEFSEEAYTAEIHNAFSQLGVNFGTRAIRLFMSNDDPLGKTQSPYTRQMLAEILGMYVFSSYSAANDNPNDIRNVVNNYYEKNGLSVDSSFSNDNPEEDSINERAASEKNKGADNKRFFHKPSDLHFLTKTLANAINYAYGREYANFFLSGTGTRKMLLVNKSYLDIFLSKKPNHEFVSDQLKLSSDEFFSQNPALRNFSYLRPGPQGIETVESLDSVVDNMRRAKALGRLNERELADVFIGMFVESVMKSEGRAERLVIPFHNIADKDVFRVFTVNLSETDQDRFLEKKGDQYSVNRKILSNQISDLFSYYNEVSEAGIEKWYRTLQDSGSVNMAALGTLEEVMMDPVKLGDFMLYFWEISKTSPDLLERYQNFVKGVKKRSGLVLTRDFAIIEDEIQGRKYEVIVPGKGVHYNYLSDNLIDTISSRRKNPVLFKKYLKAANGHMIFNLENQEKLFTGEEDARYDNIKNIFGDQFFEFTKFLKEIRFQTPDAIKNVFTDPKTGTPRFRKLRSEGNFNVHSNWDWNPFYEAFFFSYLINDVQVSAMFMGDYSMMDKGVVDFIKRSSQLEAPGMFPNTNDPLGIGQTSKVVIFNDVTGIFKELEAYTKSNGKPYKSSYKKFDGAGYMNPVWYHLLNRSMGGGTSSLGKGVLKPVYNHMGLYLKYAATPITGSMAGNSPELERLVYQSLLSDELKNFFRVKLQEYITSGMNYQQAFERTSIDTAEYVGINNLQDDLIAQFVSSSSVKHGALNINELEDDEFVTIDIQNRFFRIQTNLEQDVEDTEVSNFNQIYSQMGIGIHNTARVNRLNELQARIARKYAEQIERQVRKMSKKGKKMDREAWHKYFRSIGLEATQNIGDIGFLVDMLNSEKSDLNIPVLRKKLKQYFGNRITQNGIKPKMNGVRHNQSPSSLFKLFEYEGKILTHADIVRKKIDPSLAVMRDLRPLRIENGVVQPAEVLINYSYVKEFGIRPDMTLDEAREFIALNNPGSLAAFEESLKMFIGRVPASSPASAFLAVAVGFMNDTSNMVIIPDEHNVFTGADYDGDQLNVYFAGLSKDEEGNLWVNRTEDGSDVSFRNKILDIVSEHYNDVNNFDIIYAPTELETFRKALEDRISDVANKVNSYAPNTVQSFMFMSRMVNEGKNMTGRFANSIKTYSMLVQADNVNKTKDPSDQAKFLTTFALSNDGKNQSGMFIIEFLGKMLQGSVDNAKELLLGALGVNMDNGNIITAMAVEGWTPETAFKFFSEKSVNKVFRDLASKNRLTTIWKNKFNEKWTVYDEIRDKLDKLQDTEDTSIIVPADELLESFDKRIRNKNRILTDDDVPSSFYENQQVLEESLKFYTENIANPEQGRAALLELRKAQREKAVQDLEQLGLLSLKGEAIWRLTQVVSVNTGGIPVFEYDIYKKNNDVEFILNQTLSNFFSKLPAPIDENFWKTKKRVPADVLKELDKKEKYIRSIINHAEVIRNLPHIYEFTRLHHWAANEIYPKAFLMDTPFMRGLFTRFQDKIKKNSFAFSNNYNAFSFELEKFLIALYFDQNHAATGWDNIASIVKGASPLRLSNPSDRVKFGYQFPKFIHDSFFDQTASSPTITERWADNRFLQRLDFAKENNGMFIELRDSLNISDDEMISIRNDFKKLSEAEPDVAQAFALYFLMKDGFVERKGSIMKIMGLSVFDDYSSFLRSFHKLADSPEKSVVTLSTGEEMSITDLFEKSFMQDVPFYLLSQIDSPPSQEIAIEDQPEVFRKLIQMGEYRQYFLVHRDDKDATPMTGKYMSRFNPYEPGKSVLTGKASLKSMNWDDFWKFNTGKLDDSLYGIKVRFKGRTSFEKGQYVHIIDGTLAQVTRVNRNEGTVYLLPVSNRDNSATDLLASVSEKEWKDSLLKATKIYKGEESKTGMLKAVMSNSMNHYYRELAGALLASPRIDSVLEKGKILWVTDNHEVVLNMKAIGGMNPRAVFQRSTGNIYMVSERLKNPFETERVILHELLHNFTVDVLQKDPNLLTANEQDFVKKVNNLYQEAIAANEAMKSGHDIKLRNVYEFVVESLTNPSFQEFLASVQTSVDTGPVSLWDKLMNILSDFFSGVSDKYYVNASVLEGVTRVTGKFLTTPVSSQEIRGALNIFGKMNDVKDKDVDDMIKSCK